jgi:uncharacterized membrane protein YqjE
VSAGSGGQDLGRPSGTDESLGTLFGNLTSDLSDLLRSEMELARVEIREEAAKAGRAAGLLGAGALVAYLGLGLLAMAAAWGLAEVVDAGWAFLIVGLLVAVTGGVLLMTGRNQLREVRPDAAPRPASGPGDATPVDRDRAG